eukprot:GEMP01020284.1.p1 GENE.GEMP01020284.1~~GEMP01020284.1.p1  ORF type:complete len:659 (+),score=192.27 GEMP01020284.1:74-2050(+)
MIGTVNDDEEARILEPLMQGLLNTGELGKMFKAVKKSILSLGAKVEKMEHQVDKRFAKIQGSCADSIAKAEEELSGRMTNAMDALKAHVEERIAQTTAYSGAQFSMIEEKLDTLSVESSIMKVSVECMEQVQMSTDDKFIHAEQRLEEKLKDAVNMVRDKMGGLEQGLAAQAVNIAKEKQDRQNEAAELEREARRLQDKLAHDKMIAEKQEEARRQLDKERQARKTELARRETAELLSRTQSTDAIGGQSAKGANMILAKENVETIVKNQIMALEFATKVELAELKQLCEDVRAWAWSQEEGAATQAQLRDMENNLTKLLDDFLRHQEHVVVHTEEQKAAMINIRNDAARSDATKADREWVAEQIEVVEMAAKNLTAQIVEIAQTTVGKLEDFQQSWYRLEEVQANQGLELQQVLRDMMVLPSRMDLLLIQKRTERFALRDVINQQIEKLSTQLSWVVDRIESTIPQGLAAHEQHVHTQIHAQLEALAMATFSFAYWMTIGRGKTNSTKRVASMSSSGREGDLAIAHLQKIYSWITDKMQPSTKDFLQLKSLVMTAANNPSASVPSINSPKPSPSAKYCFDKRVATGKMLITCRERAIARTGGVGVGIRTAAGHDDTHGAGHASLPSLVAEGKSELQKSSTAFNIPAEEKEEQKIVPV